MAKYGIEIKTYNDGGRLQHDVCDLRVKPNGVGEVSQEVVEAQKKVNELLWGEMPEGAKNLVSIIKYKAPKKSRN